MRPIPGLDLEENLKTVREKYIEASLMQRLAVIKLRLEDHHFGANRIVTAVSAVEAFVRSLLLHKRAKGKRELIGGLYDQYRDADPESMIVDYLRDASLGSPRQVFGSCEWVLFSYAVRWRNLVAHECTYMGLDKFPAMIDACGAILEKLVDISGLESAGIRDAVNQAGLEDRSKT